MSNDRKYTGHGHHRAMVRIEHDDGRVLKHKLRTCFRTSEWFDDGSRKWVYTVDECENPDITFESQWEELGKEIKKKVEQGAFRYNQVRGVEI
jgi:hypothetical protein